MVRTRSRLSLGGTRVDVWDRQHVLAEVASRLSHPSGPPLFLASANLDHISHFGPRGCSRHLVDFEDAAVRWLVLLDGVPLVWRSRRLLGDAVEQLAGSDLLGDVLAVGAAASARVGVLGGAPETHELLRQILAETSPDLHIAECWAPTREDLDSPVRCLELAEKVAASGIDLLVVALGKPRQEHFLAEYGLATGAHVAVAFGAAIDFLAGRVQRAPERVRHAGCEWLWRLAHEPRRLARRYLIAGPPGAAALLRDSCVLWRDGQGVPTAAALHGPLEPVLRLPQQRGESSAWTGAERRCAERRQDAFPAARDSSPRIPQQWHPERRAGADRRVSVMSET